MAIVHGYVTLPEVKAWMSADPEDWTGANPKDDLYEAAINAVSRYIDKKCKRHFFQVTEARDLQADDLYNLALPHFHDLVDVTTFTTDEDGDGVFETTWIENTDFELRPKAIKAAPEEKPYRSVRAIGRTFPINVVAGGRLERIRINGVWGWPDIPDAITQATKIQVARVIKRKEAPEGILGLNQFGVLRVSGKPDPDVMDLIGPYRLRSVG